MQLKKIEVVDTEAAEFVMALLTNMLRSAAAYSRSVRSASRDTLGRDEVVASRESGQDGAKVKLVLGINFNLLLNFLYNN